MPCDGPRMNRQVDVGNPPRPFRHLRMTERRTPDPSSSRVPVHSALVQKSVTAITNPAGRLSLWMLGKSRALGKWKTANSWQTICNQSNAPFTNGLANDCKTEAMSAEELKSWDVLQRQRSPLLRCGPHCGPRKDLILLTSCAFILRTQISGP